MHTARQPVELGNQYRALALARLGECCSELRATVQSVRALAGFHLDELGRDLDPLGLGEPGQRNGAPNWVIR